MAANVETMAYYGAMPWHKLGTEVMNLMTADEALEKGGLKWKVTKEKIYFFADGKKLVIPERYATVRDTDHRALGVVGKSYQPVQNADALNFMDALTQTGEAKYETVGALNFGKTVWMMAKIPNGAGADPIEKYLLCTTSHDGTSPVMVTATPVRVVCQNTLNAALRGAKNKFRIRHTTNVDAKIEEARKTLADSLKYFTKLETKFEQMKDKKFTQAQLENLVLKVFKNTEDAAGLSKRQTNSLDGILGEITALTEAGMGVNLPGVKGTAWGAYNAVTEFLDHNTNIKGGKGIAQDEKLMNSVWFGTVAQKTQSAFDNILEMVKLAA